MFFVSFVLILSLAYQKYLYKISNEWPRISIIEKQVREEKYNVPSKYKGFIEKTRYYHKIKYLHKGKIEDIEILGYDTMDIRENPQNNNVYLRKEINSIDITIRLIVSFIFFIFAVLLTREAIKKISMNNIRSSTHF